MKKILVVDDESSITDGLLALLDLESIEADGAYDRESAEAMIAREFYPIVLADLRLKSESEGLALIDAIRRISPRSKIATLTAYATPELEVKLAERGSSMVLRKPMPFEEILAALSEMLGHIEAEAVAQQQRTNAPLELDQLYSDVRRILYSIPQRRYGFAPEEAEELVQEAWMLFLEKQGAIELAKPWLAGTVRNLCKQQIYRKQRHRARTYELSEGEELASKKSETSDIDRLMVEQALGRIDERSRKLCTLIGMEGWSYEEVSQEMVLPIGSVGPLYIRAKNKLKKALTTAN
jgi:RNA polymerase sigma factor (sigma-70 family)